MTAEFKSEEAVKFLCKTFEKIDPENVFRVKLSGGQTGNKPVKYKARIRITGFSEENRKKHGKLDSLKEIKGSVYLYGDQQPDFCVTLDIENKMLVFFIDDLTTAQNTGLGDSILHISSGNWKRATTIDIFIKNIYTDKEAMTFLTKTLIQRVNSGEYTARLGKWISKKSFDRSIKKVEADKMAIAYEIAKPEEESMRTMHIGADIQSLEFKPGKPGEKVEHILKAKHQHDSSTVRFIEIVVEHNVSGREIGSKTSKSTYIFFVGTPFNSRVNLLILRHRS